MATSAESGGIEALHRLKSIDPPLYLSPSADLSEAARSASQYLFSHLRPFTPKSPFDRLLTDGFDSEQIWQQIDLQSQPLISSLRRDVKRFEKNPEEISKIFGRFGVKKSEEVKRENGELKRESEGFEGSDGLEDDEMNGIDEDDDDDDEDEEGEEVEEEEEEEGEEDEEKKEEEGGGVEDRFLKIKELEEYLEDDEAREYGVKKKKAVDKVANEDEEEDEDEDEEEDEDEDEEEDDDNEEENEDEVIIWMLKLCFTDY